MTQRINKYNLTFALMFVFHLVTLLFMANDFSVSFKEVEIFNHQTGLSGVVSNIFPYFFGKNIIFLKLPFIVFYLLSSILIYLLTKDYFRYQKDRVMAAGIFMILPGVNSAALLINESIIVIFCTLLYLYIYKTRGTHNYFLLFVFLFIDNSFAIFYLALFFYSLKTKDNVLLFVSLLFFAISMSLYGFDIGGRPRGYFADTIGIYASIFSPLLFLYFFYAIYRFGIKYERDIFWYLAITALLFSLIVSLRQKVYIEDFAPFVVVAIPVMLKLFLHSVRVRLSEHKGNYLLLGYLIAFVLILNFIVFVFNKSLYLVMENPKKHFAYDYYVAKELADKLKELNIVSLETTNSELQTRLQFYGISKNSNCKLIESDLKSITAEISIDYFGKTVAKYDIVKN